MEGIDYRSRSGLDRAQLASLVSCEWIRPGQSLLIHGATGSGKTYWRAPWRTRPAEQA